MFQYFTLKNVRLGWVMSCVVLSLLAAGCAGGSNGTAKPKSTVTGKYAFWPQFPDAPRIQFVRSIKSTDDVSERQATSLEKAIFGRDAEESDVVNKPYGVAMRDGRIYVCDIRNDGLMVLDLKKRQTRVIGTTGSSTLTQPVAVAISKDGEIFVADNQRGAIFVYDAQERFSRVFGQPKFKPAGIAVYGDRVYVTDIATQVVQVFDRKSGKNVGTIGSVGDEDGQFRLPLGIAADSKGNIWVADMMRCRLQKFSPEGKLLSAFGELGDYRGAFARPKHIAVDHDDILYVVDAAFQNVQMFDSQNRPLMHFGSGGKFPGAMNLPAGICVSDDSVPSVANQIHPDFNAKRIVVVTNQFGGEKVSLYALGELKPGVTAQDIANSTISVSSGIITAPSEERLKLQTPGDKDPADQPESDSSDTDENGSNPDSSSTSDTPATETTPK